MLESHCIVAPEGRRANFERNMARGLPVAQSGPERAGKLAIVGSGPSVSERLDILRAWDGDIWAINGAHDYLLENGIIPNGFFAIDPLPTLADYVQNIQPQTICYLSSVCDPAVFDALSDRNVCLIHLQNEDGDKDFREVGISSPVIMGGTTAMTRAPYLAIVLGWRDITIFGADASYTDKGPYCYHWGSFVEDIKDPVIPVVINGEGPFLSELGLLKQTSQLGFILQVFNRRQHILTIDPAGLMGAFLRAPFLDDSNLEMVKDVDTLMEHMKDEYLANRKPTSFHATNERHVESDEWLDRQ